MNVLIPTGNYEVVPGISFLETDSIMFSGLSSPVLIILKNKGIHQDEIVTVATCLTSDETERSRRFRFSQDRDSYILVHGLLRRMLGRYFGIMPRAVRITYNSFGKPSVEGYPGKIFFNLSHSSGVSVLAFDPENEIGVDVEFIDEDFEYNDIVQMFFSKEEGRYIQQSGKESRSRFYEIWTRKEAFLKATGQGITENLQVDVCKEKINGNVITGKEQDSGEYFFRSMVFEQNYRITLAMGGNSRPIKGYVIGNDKRGIQFIKA